MEPVSVESFEKYILPEINKTLPQAYKTWEFVKKTFVLYEIVDVGVFASLIFFASVEKIKPVLKFSTTHKIKLLADLLRGKRLCGVTIDYLDHVKIGENVLEIVLYMPTQMPKEGWGPVNFREELHRFKDRLRIKAESEGPKDYIILDHNFFSIIEYWL